MPMQNDLSRSLVPIVQENTLVAVLEMSQSSWLVAGVVPGIERQPLKKLETSEQALMQLLQRWRAEAVKAGRTITRIVIAFEAGRDGFWHCAMARLSGHRSLRNPSDKRCHLTRAQACKDGPTRYGDAAARALGLAARREEDAKRPSRERESLVGERTRIINRMKSALVRLGIRGFKPELRRAPQRLQELRTPGGHPIPPNTLDEFRRDLARLALIRQQIEEIERARLERIEQAPPTGPHAMVRLLASIVGVGVETADMLVQEILSRNLRDRRAVARYAGLTGSPDESGAKRREKGLAKSGNARVRRGLIQLAWRFLLFQKGSALAQWYRARTEGPTGGRKTTIIVALARKLLIALWRLVTVGEIPQGVTLRSVAA